MSPALIMRKIQDVKKSYSRENTNPGTGGDRLVSTLWFENEIMQNIPVKVLHFSWNKHLSKV